MSDDVAIVAAPADASPAGGPVHLRIVLALLGSAARLIPVPFLDDVVRERIVQLMVSRTLRGHGRTFGSTKVKALWSDDRGCMTGCLLFVLKLPFTLLLFPIRKIVAWINAVRYLSRDLTEMLLLGRALDRALSEGRLSQEQGRLDRVGDEARLLRRAFDNAFSGMELGVLRSLLGDALSKVKGIGGAAVRSLRSLFRREEQADEVGDADVEASLGPADRAAVEDGASRVEAVLARPEVVELLREFDRRFDENVAALASHAG